MKKRFAVLACAGIISLVLLSFDSASGWFAAGSHPKSYEMGIDKGAGQDGKNAATIKSIKKKIKGFGTFMQMCAPDKFLGKRVHMSGMIKTVDVKEWAGLWFRVDGGSGALSFDNMHDRAVSGNTDWKSYEIVLDVPVGATNLAYGSLLSGTGQVWFDKLTFEIVDNTVPTTGESNKKKDKLPEPVNLDFEE